MTGSLAVVAADQCSTTIQEYLTPFQACCSGSASACNTTTCGTSQCKDAFNKIINDAPNLVAGLRNCTGAYAELAKQPSLYFRGDACKKREACGFDACPHDPKTCDGAVLMLTSKDTVCPKDNCSTQKCRAHLDSVMTNAETLVGSLASCADENTKKMASHSYIGTSTYDTQVKCGFVQSPCVMNNTCFQSCGDPGPITECSKLNQILDGCGSSCNECHKNLLRDWQKCNGKGQTDNARARGLPAVGHAASLVLGMTLAVVGLA